MSDPIQNLEKIDVVGEKKDGTVDLCIVVSGFLDATPHHENLLRAKIQAYTDVIFSDTWLKKYGEGNSRILIKAVEMPHQEIINLIGAIKNHLAEFGVNIHLEFVQPDKMC